MCLNMPFKMSFRVSAPPSICSQIQKWQNLILEGDRPFSYNSDIKKKSKLFVGRVVGVDGEGGGVKQNW